MTKKTKKPRTSRPTVAQLAKEVETLKGQMQLLYKMLQAALSQQDRHVPVWVAECVEQHSREVSRQLSELTALVESEINRMRPKVPVGVKKNNLH
jgi:hypothetical protein